MSLSPHHIPNFRLTHVLLPAAVFVSVAACYPGPSGAPQPTKGDQVLALAPWSSVTAVRRFPGVDIVPTAHSSFIVKIHSGLVGDGEPLYVIDGAPLVLQHNRGIDWFKPEDITEIKVLKRPEDLTIFGPQGVNGVILITTKQAASKSRAQ